MPEGNKELPPDCSILHTSRPEACAHKHGAKLQQVLNNQSFTGDSSDSRVLCAMTGALLIAHLFRGIL